ncbi:MAG: 1-phosphofructokinase family hexose kinase, partial [Alphaproteobacteria bacterium]|nr:1-phosphofructokinase family hexose kinase [Alphaproteobacteria bacterium]
MSKIVTLTPNPAVDVWTTTPRIEAGPKLRCSEPKIAAGGGGVNVSRVIRRLEGRTVALFAAGGLTGDELSVRLQDEDVPMERLGID